MMLPCKEKLLVVGAWRLFLLRATSVLCNYPAAVCEAIVVVSEYNEILLKAALAFTNSLAFYLSVLLRLNAFLRRTLAGVLFSREDLDQHGRSSCSTWPSSPALRNNSCSPLLCGGRRSALWLKSVQAVLSAVPKLCRRSWSVCVAISDVIHVAASVLSALGRPSVSTITAVCGCLRTVVTVFQALGVAGDLLPL